MIENDALACELCILYEEEDDFREATFSCESCHRDCCEAHFGKDNCTDCGDDDEEDEE